MNDKLTKKYIDWRLLGEKTLQKDWTHPTTGKVYKAGSPIELVGSVYYDGIHTLDFPIPSMTSLFLSQAYEDWTASQYFLTEEKFLDKPDRTDVSTVIHPKEDYIFFSLSSFQTTRISPSRRWLRASSRPWRSALAPDAVSVKMRSQPAL